MRDRCDRLIGHAGECSSAPRAQASDAPASPWVRASERQPPVDMFVIVRSPIGEPYAYRRKPGWDGLFDAEEWLDIAAVERLAGEADRLREELVNEREISGARIDRLEAENDNLRSRNAELREKLDWAGEPSTEDLRRQVAGQADEIVRLREALEEEKRRHASWFRNAHTWHHKLSECERERDDLRERLAGARAVAERAENAARDAADRLAAYATPKHR